MKKIVFLLVVIGILLYVLKKPRVSPDIQNNNPLSQEEFKPQRSLREPSSQRGSATLSSPEKRNTYNNIFLKNLPSSLNKQAWSHEIVFEDNRFVATQLKYADKNVDTYFYRWKKDAQNNLSLAAGIIPTPSGIAGKFTDSATQEKFLNNLKTSDKNSTLNILGHAEVWELGYDNVLHPRIRAEIEYTKQGIIHHENLYLDSSTGKITNRRELDRH